MLKLPVKKQKEHYVDNRKFLDAIVSYRIEVANAKKLDLERPRCNNYIGSCFLKIATHLSYRPNFINYMYKDDMVCDGVENCIQYIDNFDPAKSTNPFAYFTQIVYYAFLRRIAKEKRQLDIKDKIIERSDFGDLAELSSHEAAEKFHGIKNKIEMRMNY
jgi:hypothetical protein